MSVRGFGPCCRATRQLASLGAVVALAWFWWCAPHRTVASAAMSVQTRVRIFDPFASTGSLLPQFQRARSASGTCWTGSLADNRSDAWRCMVGYGIYDPCFASPDGRNGLLCIPAPWSRSLLHLRLQKPLPSSFANHGRPPQGLPWAVELSTGGRCTMLTGPTPAVAGRRLSYACSNGDAYGGVSRRGGRWSVLFAKPHSSALTRVRIAVAWY